MSKDILNICFPCKQWCGLCRAFANSRRTDAPELLPSPLSLHTISFGQRNCLIDNFFQLFIHVKLCSLRNVLRLGFT